ncbi:hypothetical protein CVT24_007133 [Panaeolus cyanescens]|uniref:Btz domain-containing protein n=1 Tax=Panaeolus cyanescens TaxID=181874 RepID=A0A409YNW0_9AGAR|nr:hypothetical protein CVT24_007133 [Panaeolus cyanescens]
MPTTAVKQSSSNSTNKSTNNKSRAAPPAKGRRIFRRRGRARDELDSDDELEREAATDSDSDNTDLSLTDSATDDSDTEPASDDVIPHDRTHLPTPRNSQSPDSIAKESTRQMNGDSSTFFAASTNWSDNVEREEAEGANEVPVIDFADFDAKTVERLPTAPKSKKAKQKAKRAAKRQAHSDPATAGSQQPSVPSKKRESPPKDDSAPLDNSKLSASSAAQESSPSTYVSPARQAYQQRLETDPSYVPKIGNFWGHDDRLIDADLRSLSFWWNSQRGGRGRGRGGFRGRGGHHHGDNIHKSAEEQDRDQQADQVPPIERTWTHDGFEELKRKEEQRRSQAAARQESASKRGALTGARGGFGARGRGGFTRGGLLSPGGRNSLPQNRIRFIMKPEVMWTKQSETFLFLDPAMKPRHGQGPGFRVRIPGNDGEVVRAPLGSSKLEVSPAKASQPTTSNFTVRLPRAQPNADVKAASEAPVEVPEQEPHDEHPIGLEERPTSITPHQAPTPLEPTVQPSSSALPLPSIRTQLEQITLEPAAPSPERQALTEQAVLRKPSVDLGTTQTPAMEQAAATERPTLPPLQTTFTPPPPPQPQVVQPAPGYGPPYGYPPQLPPGIGLNPHGMPYELTTGRPVYLPHPPPMYNPRPMMHSHNPSMTFVPGHMHHPSSGTPDFLAQPPHTPPVNGFIDPVTGNPMFSFPRPNARIEIRPPGEESSKSTTSKSSAAPRTSTNLRTVAPPFQPSAYNNDPTRQAGGYYTPSDASLPAYDNSNGHMPIDDATQGMPNGMMSYPPYQQPYYYPEPYGYSQQYMDMSQHGHYDMYNMDQVPQGTVYY